MPHINMQYIPLENNILVQFEVVKNDKYTKIITGTEQEPEYILSSNNCVVLNKGKKVNTEINIGDKLILSPMRNQTGELLEMKELVRTKALVATKSTNFEADAANMILGVKKDTIVLGVINENSITCIVRNE